jgi:hypothetical protein
MDEFAMLNGLLRVDSSEELDKAITEETSLLVIDDLALAALPEGYLAERAGEGRAIMGINIFANDLAKAAGFPSGGWPTPEEWAQTHNGHGEGSFYSYMFRSAPGQPSGAPVVASSTSRTECFRASWASCSKGAGAGDVGEWASRGGVADVRWLCRRDRRCIASAYGGCASSRHLRE